MLSTILLPDANQMHLLEEINLEAGKLVLKVIKTQESDDCPDC